MLGPFATASRPFTWVSSGTVARRLRIDVRDIDNNDDNDNE